MEFHAHQRDENNAKHSERNPWFDASVNNLSSLEAEELITLSSLPLISPTLAPPKPELNPIDIDADILHGPTADVEDQQNKDHDEDSCPSNLAHQRPTLANGHKNQLMEAIESCRLDFQLWQHADIGCDELPFEELSYIDPPSPGHTLLLRVDVITNSCFIEYETAILNLLD